MKKQLEKHALQQYNKCCQLGLNLSYLSILGIMYEVASERKQYTKCHIINELMSEDINS